MQGERLFRRHLQVGNSLCIVESRVVVCIVEPDTDDESRIFSFASRYKTRLAFIEALPDGRELVVFDRSRFSLQ